MADTEHMADTHPDHGASDEHGAGHGHASAEERLGPVDLVAWAYALVGSLMGLVVLIALYLARGA